MSDFFESIMRLQSRGRLLAAWVLEGAAAGSKALFGWDGARYAQLCRDDAFPPELAAELSGLSSGRSGIWTRGDARVFLEPLNGSRRLVVCGAGHVALSVIRLGVMLGFEVTVIEDREAFAEKARSIGAHRVLCQPFGEALDALEVDAMTAFVVMTREHVHDVECLRCILQKPCAYVGMMGSRARTASVRQMLLDEGFDPGRVEGVRMPIGLSIGARTPEEIAVSVAAELISVMNGLDAGEGYPRGMLEALVHPTGPAVLAMIVEKRGEAPRRPGAKLLVRSDGPFLGTVGGGYAEARILEAADAMLRDGCRECWVLGLEMQKGTMQCGGEIEVLMLPL